jgi:hypothetical protein
MLAAIFMKALIFSWFLMLYLPTLAQDLKLKQDIEIIVDSIRKGTPKPNSFEVQRDTKGLSWLYSYKYFMNQPVCIYREASYKNTLIVQEFYFKGGQLLYSEERIVTYHDKGSSTWAGYYYFVKGQFDSYFTLGHGKSESNKWEPRKEVLRNLKECRSDISNHLKGKLTAANISLLP